MTEEEYYLKALRQLKDRLENLQTDEDNGEINFFSAVDMSRQEIKHSAFLAWLLSSEKSHKLGSTFAEKLCDKLYDYQTKQSSKFPVLQNQEIIQLDKSDFLKLLQGKKVDTKPEVETHEDKRIDILINIPETKTVIVIENKTFTTSHSDQLENYRKYIDNSVSGFSEYKNKFYIYLSPFGEIPVNNGGDGAYNKAWCVLDYECVLNCANEILSKLYQERGKNRKEERRRQKLIFILEDYINMVKTNILMENPTLLEECKKIMDDKKLRAAFDLLTRYTQTATEERVLEFVREYLGAVEDDTKSQRWFYTAPMKTFFERQGETINNRLCRCVCQPIGAQGGIVGIDIVISLEKLNGAWTNAQKKILNKVLPNGDWQNKKFSGPADTRIVLLEDKQRGMKYEEVKPKLEERLQKFKVMLNHFEEQLSEIE